jgi:hypothetical protein
VSTPPSTVRLAPVIQRAAGGGLEAGYAFGPALVEPLFPDESRRDGVDAYPVPTKFPGSGESTIPMILFVGRFLWRCKLTKPYIS